jgi:hypothetical protein
MHTTRAPEARLVGRSFQPDPVVSGFSCRGCVQLWHLKAKRGQGVTQKSNSIRWTGFNRVFGYVEKVVDEIGDEKECLSLFDI